jgi:hypothetical protein
MPFRRQRIWGQESAINLNIQQRHYTGDSRLLMRISVTLCKWSCTVPVPVPRYYWALAHVVPAYSLLKVLVEWLALPFVRKRFRTEISSEFLISFVCFLIPSRNMMGQWLQTGYGHFGGRDIEGRRQRVWGPTKKVFRLPSKGRPASNLYIKSKNWFSVAEWLGLRLKGLICSVGINDNYRERKTHVQHSRVPGPDSDCWAPVICTGVPPSLLRLVGTGASSVGIAPRYRLKGRDFLHPSRPAPGPIQPAIQWILDHSRG